LLQTSDKVPYLDLPAQIRSVRKEIDAAIARTIDICSFCLGPDVAQFENDFAEFCGVEHCVAMNSGTSALHVALLLLDIKPGDEVITTPFTSVPRCLEIPFASLSPAVPPPVCRNPWSFAPRQ
jgi:dTDP-4-amino-4,6-dideoxygalactose transaminase